MVPETDIPRRDVSTGVVERMVASERSELKDDGNTLFGYAAVFDQPEEIVDETGFAFREKFARGAFKKTLRERADRIQPLFNHGKDPSIGRKPLGVFTVLREDGHGLYYEVALANTSYNADIRELLSQGALRGNSIRMLVTRDSWRQDRDTQMDERTVREAVLEDLGPVSFPAYAGAVASLRDRDNNPEDAESTSGDAGGTSDTDAAPTSPDAALTSEITASAASRDRELELAASFVRKE